jgi:hypothetical protein
LCALFADASAQNISRIEYFFNTDPGFGHATAVTGFTPSANVAGFPVSIDVSSVSDGVNILYMRSKDSDGKWSITNVIPFVKVDVNSYNIVRAEYFLNTDPGFGKATPFTLPASADISKQAITLNIESALLSINNLYIRTEDGNGNWSLTYCLAFIKGTVAANITTLEYYIDTDPGIGKATQVVLTTGQDISNYIFNVNVSSLTANSTHNLFVRVKNTYGVWGFTNVVSFTRTIGTGIDGITDASAAFTVFPNPATDRITLQCAPEKEMDKVELMDVQGKIIQVQSFGSSTEKQIDISKLPEGIYFVKITSEKNTVYKKVVKN